MNMIDKPYKQTDLAFCLPEGLQRAIDEYSDYMNSNKSHTLEDCYRTEIDCELRWCLREKKLSYEQYTMLKERYVYNGNR